MSLSHTNEIINNYYKDALDLDILFIFIEYSSNQIVLRNES